jgi:large subunit ribosomal protein L15
MATRLRKVRRQRGSRTHGWGQMGQHRHSGSRGGTGMAGLHKHKWSYAVKYAPDHFGHNQFKPPNRKLTSRWINIGDLSTFVDASKKGEIIDLGSMGFDKLLGQGSISTAISLKIPRASASAVEKIKAAGGSIELEETRERGAKPDAETKHSKVDENKGATAAAKI